MTGLNKIGLNQVQLNRLHLNAPFPVYRKMTGGGSSGDGFPVLPGDVTRWHFGGLTNEMMAAMDDPRLEDADGKGRFLSFKNFLWAGMSGCDGYTESFSKIVVNYQSEINSNTKITITGGRTTAVNIRYNGNTFNSYIKVTGLNTISNETNGLLIYNSLSSSEKGFKCNTDGIYKVEIEDIPNSQIYIWLQSKTAQITYSNPITVEILPLYPGFILGDGVDDFAVTEKELNFEDTYTVYTAFIPFQDDPARNMILCGKNEAKDFSINYSGTHINFQPSTGVNLAPRINQFMLLVCKRNKDTTTIINLSTGESRSLSSKEFIANPGLYYLWRNVTATFHARAAIAGQIIDNGHFTTDEEDEKVLNWHKKQYPWLFLAQAWTVVGKTNEDTDRATIANITGNGNNLVLSNFRFAENSGYGLYGQNFNKYGYGNLKTITYQKTASSIELNVPAGSSENIYSDSGSIIPIGYVYDFKIKVTGLKVGNLLSISKGSSLDNIIVNINQDGVYAIKEVVEESWGQKRIYFWIRNSNGPETILFIEQIPEYEGYLVTDGVDDKIISSAFTMGKDFTVVGEWELLSSSSENAGLSKPFSFIVYNRTIGLSLFINTGTSGITIENIKSMKAISSNGIIYFGDWQNMNINKEQDIYNSISPLSVGWNGNHFTKLAFKNLAIYPTVLSKEDCIKAYNYLQTLKAKI